MKMIVHYAFDVQGRPIDLSGQNNHGFPTAVTASSDQSGTRAAGFLAPTSRIVVSHNASWGRLGAIRIDTRIRIDALSGQTNIVELDRSTALSVRNDGIVTFSIYAPKAPEAPDPDADVDSFTNEAPPIEPTDPFTTLDSNPLPPFEWIGLNTEATFSPDATPRTVQQGQYARIMVEHDGLGTMRIWIDGTLAAIRQDIDHRVLPLVPPGQVTIGARPQDNAHTLRGAIDQLRIWREDPQQSYREFFCRQMSPDAKKCWRGIYRGIATGLADSEQAEGLRELLTLMDTFAKALAKALARLEGEDRQRLFRLSASYKRLWCQNALDMPAFEETVGEMLELIDQALPGALYALFGDIFAKFSDPEMVKLLGGGACVAETDPVWPHYIQAITTRFPVPSGLRPPDRYPPPDTDPKSPPPKLDPTQSPGYGPKGQE